MKKWLAIFLFAAPAFAQVPVTPATIPHITFVNSTGGPCAGCTLATYAAGTTTPLATYFESSGTGQNVNPIILDAAGGANIWLGKNAYKFVLFDTSSATIWSVDNVTASSFSACSTAGAINFSNSAANGLTCDPNITINSSLHVINVGTLTPAHVTIGAFGTPTSWSFDTTSPATALASLGGSTNNAGTLNQLAYYAAAGTTVSGTSAIPSAITATTQSPSDNTTKIATTAYVNSPGSINPTSLKIATGTAMTDNQGTGVKVQHSTGTVASGDSAVFDASGNIIDGGAPAAATCTGIGSLPWSCYQIIGGIKYEYGSVSVPSNGTSYNTSSVTFPLSYTNAPSITISTVGLPSTSGDPTTPAAAQLQTSSSTSFTAYMARVIVAGAGGANFDQAITMNWHAIGQ
jgi:hypothetical protein